MHLGDSLLDTPWLTLVVLRPFCPTVMTSPILSKATHLLSWNLLNISVSLFSSLKVVVPSRMVTEFPSLLVLHIPLYHSSDKKKTLSIRSNTLCLLFKPIYSTPRSKTSWIFSISVLYRSYLSRYFYLRLITNGPRPPFSFYSSLLNYPRLKGRSHYFS